MAMMAMVGNIPVRAETAESLDDYAINGGVADKALLEFAQQSREVKVSLLFPSDVLNQFITNAVHGRYRADDALNVLLRDTGLSGSISAQGVVIITKTDGGEMAMKKNSRLGWLGGILGFASAQMITPLTGTAYAQSPAQQPAAAEELSLEEVVITGSRIQRPGFTSPTPVTSLDASIIEQKAQVNIANVLNEIPAFRPTVTETSAAQVNNTVGANFADLRGLGAARTLVLMNGQRIVPQAAVGGSSNVDTNIFPSIGIQRIDVVTGGASSAWGSDAVAGVVNLQMYRRYEGLKTDLQYGISSRGDNEGYAAQFLAGASFGERAHLVVAGAWSRNDGVGDLSHRPWGQNWPHVLRDSTRPGCTNRPQTNSCWLAGEQWQLVTAAPGGVIFGARVPAAAGVLGATVNANTFNNSPLNNVAFGVSGAPYNMPQGYFRSGSDGIFGGSVPGNYDGYLVPLKAPSNRLNFYGNFEVDITDDLTTYLMLNFSERHARNFTNTMIISYDIFSGNPFIPASTQAQMNTLNYGAIRVGVKHNDVLTTPQGVNGTQINGRTRRVSAGFDWRLGGSWKLDGYVAYNDNNTQNFAHGQRNFANARQAADAILGANGAVVCRNPANGCVPINIFGIGSPSPAALDFITSDQDQRVNMYQRTVAVNLSGEPFSTWAGPASVASGIEYRKESKKDLYDPLTQAGAMNNAGTRTLDFAGELDVKEGYIEAAIPLISDVPAIKSFELNGAYRTTDYSTMGKVNTWKGGVIWKVIDPLLLRATVSRDIRAPSINDLLAPVNRTSGTQIVGQADPVDVFSGGNPNLKTEKANGLLFGITYRPSEAFGATVDYYDLEIEDVIFSAGAQQIANACAAGNAVACGQVFRDDPSNPNRVTRIISGNSNVAELILKGIDAEIFSTLRLGSIPGSINLRAQGTYADKLAYRTTADQPLKDYAGQNTRGINDSSPYWAPRFKGSLSIGYNLEGFSGSVVGNYLSSGLNQVGIPLSDFAQNEIAAYWKLDLNLSYRFGGDDQFQVYGNVRNLGDKDPPFAPSFTIDIPTSSLYDTVGRTYVVGFRYSL